MIAAGEQATAAVERALAPLLKGRRIRRLTRVPSPNRSSFSIDELTVLLEDGTVVELVAKALNWDALSTEGLSAKPPFLWHAERERATYDAILSQIDVGAPRYFGTCPGDSALPCLLLERVNGVPIWQRGDVEAWCEAARWLAGCHRRITADLAARTEAGPHLLRYDRGFYECWAARSLAFCRRATGLPAVVAAHARLVPSLLAEPVTFLHGEFYPANVLVEDDGATRPPRVRPVDWEMAAIGPPLMDLACLIAGRWADERREAIADAYFVEHSGEGGTADDRAGRLRALDMCLVHLSVRNLGWSRDWVPPPDRAFDWLAEAQRLCSKWNF